MAAKVTDKAAPKMIQMLALWQRAQPHSMPGSSSLILIPKTKIIEMIRKNTFTDWAKIQRPQGTFHNYL